MDGSEEKTTLTKEEITSFKEAEINAENFFDLRVVADDIAEAGDKYWAKEIYKQLEDKAKTFHDFFDLSYGVCALLCDKEWAKEIYKKTEDKAESFDDYLALADSVYYTLEDQSWPKLLFKEAENKVEYESQYSELANSISEIYDDQEWVKELYNKDQKNDDSDLSSMTDKDDDDKTRDGLNFNTEDGKLHKYYINHAKARDACSIIWASNYYTINELEPYISSIQCDDGEEFFELINSEWPQANERDDFKVIHLDQFEAVEGVNENEYFLCFIALVSINLSKHPKFKIALEKSDNQVVARVGFKKNGEPLLTDGGFEETVYEMDVDTHVELELQD